MTVELLEGRSARVGAGTVTRLPPPKRRHRTVGAWCFADPLRPEVVLGGHADVALDAAMEHAVLVVDGVVTIDGTDVEPGTAA